jgi:hypothetical protein
MRVFIDVSAHMYMSICISKKCNLCSEVDFLKLVISENLWQAMHGIT